MNIRYAMNIIILSVTIIFYILLPFNLHAQHKVNYTLKDIIDQAKGSSPAALRAATLRESSNWEFLYFQSNYTPQLKFDGILPSYSQSVIPVTQPDGTIEFREVEQNIFEMGWSLQQPITSTGGTISVNASINRFDNLKTIEGLSGTRWSGIPVNLSVNQPVFGFNYLKWDKRIKPLIYEENKRLYLEELENISQRATDLFFNFLLAQVKWETASRNKENLEEILQIENARYHLATTTEDQLLQVELSVLRAEQSLSKADLDMETSALALRSYIGLNESSQFKLILPQEIPEFNVDVNLAIELAFKNRSETVNFKRRELEADADIARAKSERFEMNINASYGYNNAAMRFSDIYTHPNRQALASLGISIPILDWGRSKARMGIAKANKELVEFTVKQEMIIFEETIFTKVKNFHQLRNQILISKKADTVADKRYELSKQRYYTGGVDITNLNIAQQEKDSNREAYVSSLRDFWLAYYELRQLTLYDFNTNEYLITEAANNSGSYAD